MQIHVDHVVQGLADGHIPVIGHHGQEEVVHSNKNYKKIDLNEASNIGDGFALCMNVQQHLWDGGGGETDVNKRQIAEEEVHGCVEVGV